MSLATIPGFIWSRTESSTPTERPRYSPSTTMAKPLLDEAQGSICCWELTGVQHLYACIVVAIERCHGTRTTSVDRLCRIRKPKSKVVQLDRNWAGVKDEGLIAEDPSYV